MMASFLTQVEGFTPVIDVVVNDVGLTTAAVYGAVWRYCQMKDGVCRASMETIGQRIGLSRQAVFRHIKMLCEAGYLVDKTPDRRNVPHVYADAGQVKIAGLLSIKNAADMENERCNETLHRCNETLHPGVTKRYMKIHDKDRKEDTPGDFLKDITKNTKGKKENTWNADLPRGWRDATEPEYRVCERVAQLWAGGALPRFAQDIERNLAAAKDLLGLHDGDLRATLRTIDEHHKEHGEDGLTIAGPWSLRNIIPSYVANSGGGDGKITIGG